MPSDIRKAIWGLPSLLLALLMHVPPMWWWWGFLILLDFVSALISAAVRGIPVTSREGLRGGAKKALAVVLALSAEALRRSSHIDTDIAALVVFYFCVIEVISIAENCASAGIPVPGFLLRLLTAMKEQADPKADPKGNQ